MRQIHGCQDVKMLRCQNVFFVLKKYQCLIDLANNQLLLRNGQFQVRFLTRTEISPLTQAFGRVSGRSLVFSQHLPAMPEDPTVAQLIELGFERRMVVEALEASRGNREIAMSLLLGTSIKH